PGPARAGMARAGGVGRTGAAARQPERAKGAPAWSPRIRTESLALAGARSETEQTPTREAARAAEPWSVRGVDLSLEASLERRTIVVDAELFDAAGPLLTADAQWKDVRAPRSIPSARRALSNAPFEARSEERRVGT